MDSGPLSPTLLVSAVLDSWPQTVTVFVRYRVDCAGCSMAPFCSLEDVVRYYHITKEQFLFELELERHKMDKPYSLIPNLAGALPAITENTVVSRSLHKDEKTDVTLFGFAAGQELTEHRSPYTAIIQVLKGEVTFTFGKDEVKAQAGAWILMPPNLPHSLRATTSMEMLLTLIKQP
jgi:quercetin dioxygenase-like cupin family protein